MLLIANDCLKYQDNDRPSSGELCERLAVLKESRRYRESFQTYFNEIQTKNNQIAYLDQQLQEKDRILLEKENQLQWCQQQLIDIQQTVHSLQGQVDELQLQLSRQNLISSQLPPRSQLACVKLTWRFGGKTSLPVCRGATVVNEGLAYFMNAGGEVCSYNSMTQEWNEVAKCPYMDSCLAVVKGLLVAIGGCKTIQEYDTYSSKLLSLPSYNPAFLDMPTRRRSATCVTTDNILVVAGGRIGPLRSDCIDVVEVMKVIDHRTQVWSTVASLPHCYARASVAINGDQFYMLGGTDGKGWTKLVLTCSLAQLLQSSFSSSPSSVWQSIAETPAYNSTCATINGHLFAIGGCNANCVPSADIHRYNPRGNSWDYICNIPTRKYLACVAILSTGEVMVVGGKNNEQGCDTDLVEVAALNCD